MTSTGASSGLSIESSDNRMPPGFQLAVEKKHSKAAKKFTEHLEQEGNDMNALSKARVYCNRAWCYSSKSLLLLLPQEKEEEVKKKKMLNKNRGGNA